MSDVKNLGGYNLKDDIARKEIESLKEQITNINSEIETTNENLNQTNENLNQTNENLNQTNETVNNMRNPSEMDSKDNTVTFVSNDSYDSDDIPLSWTETEILSSGEKHSSLFYKISSMFKNIRFNHKEINNLKDDTELLKTPTFETASIRANILNGENLNTIFGKISKWFSDLKTGAFHNVANNLTTTSEGYVLDARQGKTLLSKITSGYTKLTSSSPGKIVLPCGATIVYGYVNGNNFTSDSSTGGYIYTAKLSSYALKNPVFGMVSGLYDNGLPEASIKSISNSSITIVSPVNFANCGIYWMVIG